jgi:DNA polymerase delta subunit 1
MFYTKPDRPDKMDCKGIESVRRDNCGLVRYCVDKMLHLVLEKHDVAGAIEFCKSTIASLLQNKIDISLLIVTKAYSKEADEYKNPQAHVVLAKRMAQRNPATAPAVGDRIPYVIVKGEKKSKMCERAEDPLYVMDHDIPIDTQYYIDQLISPLCRILTPMVENPHSLLTTGEHTRHIVIPRAKSSSKAAGGLSAFLVVREECMGCRAPLQKSEKVLCAACKVHSADIYAKYLGETRDKEMQFSRLWSHCQDCQGNRHTEVLCVANDCPIFYKRAKVKKERLTAYEQLAKFDLLEW